MPQMMDNIWKTGQKIWDCCLSLGYMELTMHRQTPVWQDTRARAEEIRTQEAGAIR